MMLNKAIDDWMNTVATLKWIFIILIALAVAAMIIVKLKKKGLSSVHTEPKTTESCKKVSVQSENADPKLILVGKYIRSTAKSFNGLYEGIYQIARCNDDNDEALIEWKLRVENMKENEELVKAFSDLFTSASAGAGEQAEKLLRCIELAGVKRSEETEYHYDLSASKKYVCLSGNDLKQGTVCTVLKPYWYIEDKIIEQGCIVGKE